MNERDALAYAAAEVTPERLALWHDYPVTEAGESMLVNAEWHGPRCMTNRTRKYADCDCSLVGAVVSIEVEAVIAARLAAEQERELHRQEALALRERRQSGELTEAQYQRRLLDIGKADDDLTRDGA